jgi:hypothetical protein
MLNHQQFYGQNNDFGIDGLPENIGYRDTGCEVFPSCLNCPLPQCKYDDPVWYQRYRRHGRDQLILAALSDDGATVTQVAEFFKLSPRTIQRALRRWRLPEMAMSA